MKRKIWHTDYTIEQCREIFGEKIPAVYKTPLFAWKKQIEGEIRDDGYFNLSLATRGKKDFELHGNLKESESGGARIFMMYKFSLRAQIFNIIFYVLSAAVILNSVLSLLGAASYIPNLYNAYLAVYLALIVINPISPFKTIILFNQIKDMFKITKKKI